MIGNIEKVSVQNLEMIFKKRKNFLNISLFKRKLNKTARNKLDNKESRENSKSLLL
jgi:hypothetical protein